MEDKILYCELMTHEQVKEFEILMASVGIENEYNRPFFYTKDKPYWELKGLTRGIGEDPLAVVMLKLYHNSKQYFLDAGYRCLCGEKIEPEIMKSFILALSYQKIILKK